MSQQLTNDPILENCSNSIINFHNKCEYLRENYDKDTFVNSYNACEQKEAYYQSLNLRMIAEQLRESLDEVPTIKLTNDGFLQICNQLDFSYFDYQLSHSDRLKFFLNVGGYYFYRDQLNNDWRAISKGAEAEQTLHDSFTNFISLRGKMYSNALINRSEHDILIISTKGIFTIEVKNHNSHMVWAKSGDFFEEYLHNGKVVSKLSESAGECVDPLKQTMRHRKTLKDFLWGELKKDYPVQANVMLYDYAQYPTANEDILSKIFAPNEFIEYFDKLPEIMSEKEVNKIIKQLEKNLEEQHEFEFIDYDAIFSTIKNVMIENHLTVNDINYGEWLDGSQLGINLVSTYNELIAQIDKLFCFTFNNTGSIHSQFELPLMKGKWHLLFNPLYFFSIFISTVVYSRTSSLFLGLAYLLVSLVLCVLFIINGRRYAFKNYTIDELNNYYQVEDDMGLTINHYRNSKKMFYADKQAYLDNYWKSDSELLINIAKDIGKYDDIKDTFILRNSEKPSIDPVTIAAFIIFSLTAIFAVIAIWKNAYVLAFIIFVFFLFKLIKLFNV